MIHNISDKKFLFYLIFISAVLSITIQIIFYISGYYSYSADESDRTLLAYKWLHGDLPKDETWLPFYTIIMAIGMNFFSDMFWISRIITGLFGCLTLAIIIILSYEIIPDRKVTLLTSVLSLFLPPLVILRVVPLSEIMYIFFIISSFYFLYKWIAKKKQLLLLFCSTLIAVSAAIRYEGWVISFSFLLYSIYQLYKKQIKISFFFYNFLIISIFPIAWIILSYLNTGDTLGYLTASSDRFRKIFSGSFLPLLKYNIVTQFIYQNLRFIIFPGLISLSYYLLNRRDLRQFSIVPSVSFIIMVILSFAEIALPTHAYWRVPLVWNILLLPFASHFFVKLTEFISESKEKKFGNIFSAIILIIVLYYIFQIFIMTRIQGFTDDELRAGRFLKEKSEENPQEKFNTLIETSSGIYLNIIVASDYPYNFILNTGPKPHSPQPAVIDAESKLNLKNLKKMKIKYLIFNGDNYKNKMTKEKNILFQKTFGKWTIYKLKE